MSERNDFVFTAMFIALIVATNSLIFAALMRDESTLWPQFTSAVLAQCLGAMWHFLWGARR